MEIPRNQIVHHPLLEEKGLTLAVKREDEIHPFISGNKYRKLKYNLKEATILGAQTLLSFGGAYSNHISALSYAGRTHGFKTIGIIRGEELAWDLNKTLAHNPTLRFAQDQGMEFSFVSREAYRNKENAEFVQMLQAEFGDFYLIPEGGTNELAIKGCEEIMTAEDEQFDFICVAIGTGGTISGLIRKAADHQKVLGFPSLKGGFLEAEIKEKTAGHKNWKLMDDYHFGGYAKVNEKLISFINDFNQQTTIPLDPIYTGKMMFGIMDLVQKDFFNRNSSILMIHTGGLQGIEGMNQRLLNKKLPLINV
ncbi:1-aminocyclopropane-1-carboxylate deaminase/D-cysteine desulfhydrase [Lutimonas sp.]|uniref:1-aminocyclopropane-1-carboxylate deaminase/D-cysteine desulfhydrase n=1 Tax=Lutimonas sp. TaxID=1872403 RepID=UPI003D9BD091